jgi:hypothetical protein
MRPLGAGIGGVATQEGRRLIAASSSGSAVAASLAWRAETSMKDARHEFGIVNRTFAIPNLPDSFQNFRFVQISDIHFEEYTEAWFLEEIVRQVNALEAELVVVTGDYISHGPLPYSYAWRAAGVCDSWRTEGAAALRHSGQPRRRRRPCPHHPAA